MNNFKCKIVYKNFFLPIIILLLAVNTRAQVYSIGDTVEILQAKSLINYPQQEFKYQKGKALILDFWATWCSPCIAQFPKTDSLKNEFSKDLDIIGVTSDKNAVVAKFLTTYKKNFGITVASVTDDQLLKRNFPHLQIPHYVWINKKGIVVAITTPEHVNEKNIRKLIAGEKLSLPVKNEYENVTDYKVLSPLVQIDEKQGFPALKSYYYLGNYQAETQSFSTAPMYDKTTNTNRIRAINVSLSALYKLAYLKLEGENYFHNNRVIYENFEEPKPDQISKKNYFSYDQIIPGNNEKEAYDKMKKMLDMEFSVTSTLQIRRMECLVLRKGDGIRLSPTHSKGETIETRDSIIKNNMPIKMIVDSWNGFIPLLPLPIVDEMGLEKTQRLTVALPLKGKTGLEGMIAAFKKQGLILTREYREMEVIVLKKK